MVNSNIRQKQTLNAVPKRSGLLTASTPSAHDGTDIIINTFKRNFDGLGPSRPYTKGVPRSLRRNNKFATERIQWLLPPSQTVLYIVLISKNLFHFNGPQEKSSIYPVTK